jgi:hypothetical protein
MAMDIIQLVQNPLFLLFILFMIIAFLYAFRSYIGPLLTALFFDYGVDAGLSFADDFLGGAGLTGLDIGDWVAACILFAKYRKQVGNGWALLFAAEAANFGLSFIPGIGEGIELLFSAVPLVSLVIFYKQYQANQVYYPVKEYAAYLRQENVEKFQNVEEAVRAFEKEYASGNYEKIGEDGKIVKDDLFGKVQQTILAKLSRAQQYIITTLQKEVDAGTGKLHQQDITTLSNAIQQATRDIETDWHLADSEANQILHSVSSLVYQVGKEEPEAEESFKQAA